MTWGRSGLGLVFAFGVAEIASPSIYAQDSLQVQKAALLVITETADKICNQAPPLSASGNSLELSGNAKAALSGAIGKVVDLGVQGEARHYTSPATLSP